MWLRQPGRVIAGRGHKSTLWGVASRDNWLEMLRLKVSNASVDQSLRLKSPGIRRHGVSGLCWAQTAIKLQAAKLGTAENLGVGMNSTHVRATCGYFPRRWWEPKEGLGIKLTKETHVHAPSNAAVLRPAPSHACTLCSVE